MRYIFVGHLIIMILLFKCIVLFVSTSVYKFVLFCLSIMILSINACATKDTIEQVRQECKHVRCKTQHSIKPRSNNSIMHSFGEHYKLIHDHSNCDSVSRPQFRQLQSSHRMNYMWSKGVWCEEKN